jgi:hypothetical protein
MDLAETTKKAMRQQQFSLFYKQGTAGGLRTAWVLASWFWSMYSAQVWMSTPEKEKLGDNKNVEMVAGKRLLQWHLDILVCNFCKTF